MTNDQNWTTSQSQLATEWQQMALTPPDPKGKPHLILIPCPAMRSFRWTEEKIGKVLLSRHTKLPGRYSSTMVNNKWKLQAELPDWRPLLIKCHLKRNLITNGRGAHAGGYQEGHTSRRMLLISVSHLANREINANEACGYTARRRAASNGTNSLHCGDVMAWDVIFQWESMSV